MKDILDRSAGERPNEHLKTLDDAIRCVAEAAEGIKAGCAAGDEWPDANDKQYYDAQVDCLMRLRNMRAALARASEAAAGEPVAWVRKHPDTGELSGDWLWNDVIEQCRKDSGVWFPLGFLAAPQPASEQQAIDLAAALEQQRALAIVAAVRAQGFAKSNSDLPTQAESVFDLACEEIEHRLRTEVWALDGMPAPLPGGQQAARGMSDAARRRLEFYSAGYCKSTNKTDREAGKALRALLARPNETVAPSDDAIKRAIAAWLDDHGFAEDFERRMRNAIRAASAAPAEGREWKQVIGPVSISRTHANQAFVTLGFGDEESCTTFLKAINDLWTKPRSVALATAPAMSEAVRDVLAERCRVVEQEGFTPEHDDEHDAGDLAAAACAYALAAADKLNPHSQGDGNYERDKPPVMWPASWCSTWWKPIAPRRDLVKAAQLIIAEIERIDRAAIELK